MVDSEEEFFEDHGDRRSIDWQYSDRYQGDS